MLFGVVGWFGGYVIAVLLNAIFLWPMIVGALAGLGIDTGYRRQPNVIRSAASAGAGLVAGAAAFFLLNGMTDSLPNWVEVLGLALAFLLVVAAGVLPAEKMKRREVTRRGLLIAAVVLVALAAIGFGLFVWRFGVPWELHDEFIAGPDGTGML